MCKHQWEGDGGCDQNPGVFDNGNGGMVYRCKCTKCGMVRRRGEDYTGERPYNNFAAEYYSTRGERCTKDGRVIKIKGTRQEIET